MPTEVANPEAVTPFTVARVIANKSRVDVAPKVTALTLAKLDVDTLKYVRPAGAVLSVAPTSSRHCVLHSDCQGHLQCADTPSIALPPYCVNNDPATMGAKDYLNRDLLRGTITAYDFAVEMRELIAGKRGLLKYSCMGFRPVAAARGVATCAWPDDYRTVLIPVRWMSRMQVPCRNTDNAGRLRSPYVRLRSVVGGDRAVLWRCPSMGERSVQSVTVRGWREASIGVHPEMCQPLNLDFDGDEVQVAIVAENESISELERYAELTPLSRFSDDSVSSALQSSVAICTPCNESTDFMLRTTRSIQQVGLSPPSSALHSLSRCKKDVWVALQSYVQTEYSPENFVANSIEAMHSLTESHLRASEGYTIGRQLKSAAFQVTTNSGGEIVSRWAAPALDDTQRVCLSSSVPMERGYPGVRLASLMSGAIAQDMLDRAKRRVSGSERGILTSLVDKGDTHAVLIDSRGNLTCERVSLDSASEWMSRCVTTTSRLVLSYDGNRVSRHQKCVVILAHGCERAGLKATERALAELAYLVCCAAEVGGCPSIAAVAPTRFLSRVGSDPMSTAVCDDLHSLDLSATLRHRTQNAVSDISLPIVAVLVGNYGLLLDKSVCLY